MRITSRTERLTFSNSPQGWSKVLFTLLDQNHHHLLKGADPLRVLAYSQSLIEKYPEPFLVTSKVPHITKTNRFVFGSLDPSITELYFIFADEILSGVDNLSDTAFRSYFSEQPQGPVNSLISAHTSGPGLTDIPPRYNTGRIMPPKRRGQPKRTRRPQPSNVASRLAALEGRIRNELVNNPKWINPAVSQMVASITTAAPYTFCVNAVAQGTGENARIGAKIRMKSFEANLTLNNSSTAQQDPIVQYRLLIIQESTTLGSNLAPTQIFLDSPALPQSMRDHTNRNPKRYHFLYDSGVQFLGALSSALASPFQNFGAYPSDRNHHISLKNLNIVADMSRANNGNVGDIDTNGVSILILTDCSVASVLSLTGTYLTEFVDV